MERRREGHDGRLVTRQNPRHHLDRGGAYLGVHRSIVLRMIASCEHRQMLIPCFSSDEITRITLVGGDIYRIFSQPISTGNPAPSDGQARDESDTFSKKRTCFD